MVDDRQPLALFDPDDLVEYEDRFIDYVVAFGVMGPAYALLFFLMPLIVVLLIVHVNIWMARRVQGMVQRVIGRLRQMMRAVLFGA